MARLIDADAVLGCTTELGENRVKFFEDAKAKYHRKPTFGDGMVFVRKAIENAPTVDAEPVRHGVWAYRGEFMYMCTECNDTIEIRTGWEPKEANYNYCPNCGAKMDGKSNVPREDTE